MIMSLARSTMYTNPSSSSRSEEHTSELQSRQYLHSFPTRRSSDLLVEGRFHLDAVHVLAAPDDHVLGAVDDVHESLVVEPGDVARVEPAVGEGRRGGLG